MTTFKRRIRATFRDAWAEYKATAPTSGVTTMTKISGITLGQMSKWAIIFLAAWKVANLFGLAL